MTQKLVVIGNGMAGARTVEEILARDGDFTVTMFGDEPYGNYNRIMLSNLLAGVETEDGIFLNDLAWYRDNGITLNAGSKIERIDAQARMVYDAEGNGTPYDKLIIATGSYSWTPPIKGIHNPKRGYHQGVFAFRTLDDTRRMITYARRAERAVVIGGGLLGLEAARGLQNHVSHVTLLHAMGHLMNMQLDERAGEMLKASVESKLGIDVIVDAMTTEILGKDRVTGVKLADGTVIDCDVVVVAAGIRPNTEMVASSGLPVERGIVVDDQMRVQGQDDIYAVGECAQHRGDLYGLVAPLWDQAKVLADHITGRNPAAAYEGSKISTKLKVAGIDVASMGLREPESDADEVIVYNEPRKGIYKQLIIRDNVLVGATLVGDNRKAASLIQAFDRGLPLPEERAELIFDIGGVVEESPESMPDDAQVCNCNGVSKGAICGAVRSGCKTVSGVMDATRAGKGCGTCKPLVQRIVEWANGGEAEEDPAASWYVPGVPMPKPELMAAIRRYGLKSVSAVFDKLVPGGAHDAKSKMGLASLLRMMWGADYVDERDARFINDRVHGNIQKDGTFSVVPQMKGGVTTPAQLKRIAEVAEKYQVPMVKLTGGQRIDLLGIPKEKLPAIWADLDMPSGYAYAKSFRTVKTCVGSDFCRFGVGDSTALGIAIEERYQGLEGPGKMKLAVTGCPRNCAEAYVKDLGVVAIDGGKWEIYVGGAAGAHIRKGDLLATVDSAAEVITLTGRFLQYYRENANWLERTYAFVPRIGIDRIRQIVVDDADGIAAALDAAVEEAVQAYQDPWKERAEPATPGQFRTSLPLTVLPQVPVRA
ncbi:nitrite reductase large subunit NirB [Actinoplanes teichomyceticus]|uniref:nitrite reductase large subunit NirB n=1 Tax=Actinoplanes teichomyceticus TaxID=1867 RepID=UPI000F0A83F3|nr:nitrite reductase large subunit NirB [Actinoplanes teichomyceticus]